MTTIYFSNCSLRIPGSMDPIAPGRKVPSELVEAMKPEELQKLLAKKRIVATDPGKHIAKAQVVSESPGVWKFPLEETGKMSLEALNMLIMEHAQKHGLPAVEPCILKEEAMHYLAQDLKG